MKILHTGDWHLGAQLKEKVRYDEHDKTLQFLVSLIKERGIEAVLIAGDVFDVFAPANRAQKEYMDFLVEAHKAGARQIIVVAGNHDSQSLIDAPRKVVREIGVSQFGHLHSAKATDDGTEKLEDHIIPLKNEDGSIAAVVLAVPYLHEWDVKQTNSGEKYADTRQQVYQGTVNTYTTLTNMAKQKYPGVKIIAMGHFWALTGKEFNPENTTMRDMMPIGEYVDQFDYFALGHIHSAETIKNAGVTYKNARFSGSLLPMKFDEVTAAKTVTIIDTEKEDITDVETVELPIYQQIKQVEGNSVDELLQKLNELKEVGKSVWVSVKNRGSFVPTLFRDLHDAFDNTCVEVLVTENAAPSGNKPGEDTQESGLSLENFKPMEIFTQLLKEKGVHGENLTKFQDLFQQVLDRIGKEKEKENAQ